MKAGFRPIQVHIGAPIQAPHPVLHFLPQVHNPGEGDAPPIDLSRAMGVQIVAESAAPVTPRVAKVNVHRPSVKPVSLPIAAKPQANGVPRQVFPASRPGGTNGTPAKLVVGKRLGRA